MNPFNLRKLLGRENSSADGHDLDFDDEPLDASLWTRIKRRFSRNHSEEMADLVPMKRGLWLRFKGLFSWRRPEVMMDAIDPALLNQAAYIRHRRLAMLAASPSVLVLIAVGAVLYHSEAAQSAIQLSYRAAGRAAFTAGNLERARFYYSRLIGSGDIGSPQDQLNWATMLASSGDSQAAIKLLDKLAPEDAVGFGPAHLQKALFLTSALRAGQVQGPDVLNRLQWHLRQSARDNSVESNQLWAFYYLAAGQPDKAIARQAIAAQLNPDLWLEAAALCNSPDSAEDRARFVGRAEAHSRQSIADNPLDAARRLMLVRVLVDRKQLDEADAILADGLKLESSPLLKRAGSDLCLVRLEQLATPTTATSDADRLQAQIRLIGQASQIDPQNPAIVKHWAALHDRANSDEHRKQIREQLEKSIVDGESTAFAHFTLGGILWTVAEQKKSLFHLEKAFELDPRFMDAANNLAWVLANQEQPDADRAEQLIRQAIQQRPNDLRYQDTLGEVLSKQGKWDEALVVLERVFPVSPVGKRKNLHRRLADAYEHLGEENLARLHRESAEKP